MTRKCKDNMKFVFHENQNFMNFSLKIFFPSSTLEFVWLIPCEILSAAFFALFSPQQLCKLKNNCKLENSNEKVGLYFEDCFCTKMVFLFICLHIMRVGFVTNKRHKKKFLACSVKVQFSSVFIHVLATFL